jgi:hypothetical protein
MPMVAANFGAIDLDHNSYVTTPEVHAFAAQRRDEPGEVGQ